MLKKFLPNDHDIDRIHYSRVDFEEHNESLDYIDNFLNNNPFVNHNKELIKLLKHEIEIAFNASQFELSIRDQIQIEKTKFDTDLKSANQQEQTKKQDFEKLISCIKSYSKATLEFKRILKEISKYSIVCDSEVVESMGHKLFIENTFELNKLKLIEVINKYIKEGVDSLDKLEPEHLFETNFRKKKPKVYDYDDFENKIFNDFENLNKKNYKIITSAGKKFERLSAGWKTSIILDIILGFEEDSAPIIIDQPEDNLATNYINSGLVKAIKKVKNKKQIILVSHNATIPMMGDAQNIILCRNDNDKIVIRSNRLEGEIDGKNVVDYIAEITDGGKSSVKKRVKKYNLKHFKE